MLWSAGALAEPFGTAFTYQGQLQQQGAQADGEFDFSFTLFDVALDGTEVTAPIELENIVVADGTFTVELDFGAIIQSDDEYWLEIGVRSGSSTDSHTLLTPRQYLYPGPRSIYALRAATSAQSDLADDADALQGHPAADFALTAHSHGDLFWKLSGNAGTTGASFLGTTDNQALELRVNASRALRLEPGISGPNVLGGYSSNSAAGGVSGATIAGGGRDLAVNQVTADFSSVGGGADNTASGYASTIGGGEQQDATGAFATIGGGQQNSAADHGVAGGGENNQAGGHHATVGGGLSNSASADYTVIGGGTTNSAAADHSAIGGGLANQAGGSYAAVSGGRSNTAEAKYAAIAGGGPSDEGNPTITNNRVSDDYGAVGGGGGNRAGDGAGTASDAAFATVAGGRQNAAAGTYAAVGGGNANTAGAYASTIAGGESNSATGNYATVFGGTGNTAGSQYATVSGGNGNSATGQGAVVAGGGTNTAANAFGTISGGTGNSISGNFATVAGGANNTASGANSAVSGGSGNTALDQNATVAGGSGNSAGGTAAVVSGGDNNDASGNQATVAGGLQNTASGDYTAVAGGAENTASGTYSLAAGYRAAAGHTGAFVWADSSADPFSSTGNDQFLIKASGGVGIGTAAPTEMLTVRGNILGQGKDDPEFRGDRGIPYTFPAVQAVGDTVFAISFDDKLVLFDATDPGNIKVLSELDVPASPGSLHVVGQYAYIATDIDDRLVIVDVSDPAAPAIAGSTTFSSHPGSIFVAGRYAYVIIRASDPHPLSALEIYDISDPANILKKDSIEIGGGTPQDLFVHNSYAYVAVGGSLNIYDISDPNAIVARGTTSDSFDNPGAVHVSGNVAFVTMRISGSLVSYDVSDPDNIVTLGSVSDNLANPWDVIVSGNYAYVTSQVNDRLAVFDVSDPSNMTPEGFTTTGFGIHSLAITGERVYVTTINNLAAFDINHLETPAIQTGSIQASQLDVTDYTRLRHLDVAGGLNVGRIGAMIGGDLAVDGVVAPAADDSHSLGEAGKRWTEVHAVNGVIQTSDGRLKQNVRPLPYGLTDLAQLEPVTFSWKNGDPGETHLGLVAQEVRDVIPELVRGGDDPTGTLGMNYAELVPVLINAVKDLRGNISDQASMIEALQERLNALEEETSGSR